jgi:hypothetical protein
MAHCSRLARGFSALPNDAGAGFQCKNAFAIDPEREARTARILEQSNIKFSIDLHDNAKGRPKPVQQNRRFNLQKD